jgi:hypothetical protein
MQRVASDRKTMRACHNIEFDWGLFAKKRYAAIDVSSGPTCWLGH